MIEEPVKPKKDNTKPDLVKELEKALQLKIEEELKAQQIKKSKICTIF